MRAIFIYNPKSGKGKVNKKLNFIKETLEAKYQEVVIYKTKSQEDTIQTAKETCGKYDALIFSGGDGTFNDITCGVSTEQVRPVLGYIPSGTVNDIARNLGIPKNVKKALKIILDGNTINHDVGVVNGMHFMYVVGTGSFTRASYQTKHDVKKVFGKLAYVFDGFKDFLKPTISKVKLTFDNQVIEAETPLILVVNSISVAGISFNKNGHLNDGKFDIVIVRKGFHKGMFNVLRLFLFGLKRQRRKKSVDVFRASSLTIQTEGNPCWTVDGEEGPKGTVQIKNLHNHLEIFASLKKNKKTKSK